MTCSSAIQKTRPIAIIGAGVLGRRIGACWASTGYKVNIQDPDASQAAGALEYTKQELWRYNPAANADQISVHTFQDLKKAVEDAWLVIECVPERLELKIDVFAELEKVAPQDTILATNSSSYKSREMTVKVQPETARRMDIPPPPPPLPPRLPRLPLTHTHLQLIPIISFHPRSASSKS